MSITPGLKKAATLCILKHKDNFLLLKRNKEPHKGKYTPVGGKLEPHETPLEAAIRETKEETGIELADMDFFGILTETSPVKYNWICYTYAAEIEWTPPPYCDEGELEWVSFDKVLDLSTPKTDWFIYDYIMKGQKFILEAVYNSDLRMLRMEEKLEGKMIFEDLANG